MDIGFAFSLLDVGGGFPGSASKDICFEEVSKGSFHRHGHYIYSVDTILLHFLSTPHKVVITFSSFISLVVPQANPLRCEANTQDVSKWLVNWFQELLWILQRKQPFISIHNFKS